MKRLLIFEDDQDAGLLLMDLVSLNGFDACLRNSFDALDPLLRWADLVLVDVDFGRQSGDIVISELRSAGLRMPVVVMGEAISLAQEATDLDPRIYVPRPFAVPELLGALERAENWVVDLTDGSVEKVIDVTAPRSAPDPELAPGVA